MCQYACTIDETIHVLPNQFTCVNAKHRVDCIVQNTTETMALENLSMCDLRA